MPRTAGPPSRATDRVPLNRDRVLGAAVALADREGTSALGMRSLARDLGVDPMSL
jgi:AcrR family transcriptional regulator